MLDRGLGAVKRVAQGRDLNISTSTSSGRVLHILTCMYVEKIDRQHSDKNPGTIPQFFSFAFFALRFYSRVKNSSQKNVDPK